MRCLVAALLITVSAHADSVVYIFTGTDNSGASPEPETFELIVPDFIVTPPDGLAVVYACNQLVSSTNCGSPGIIFSDQTVLGAVSAQLQFDSPIVGSIYDFPTGAFTTPGTYSSESGATIGTLTVQPTPEPGSMALTLSAALLLFFIRVKKLRGAALVSKP
jgi:hypothetical protein